MAEPSIECNFEDWRAWLSELDPQEALKEIRSARDFLSDLFMKVVEEEQNVIKRGLERIAVAPFWCHEKL